MSASANALRRSAHLLQRWQWSVPTGAIQEKVCSRGRPRPSASTSGLVSAGKRGHDLQFVTEGHAGQTGEAGQELLAAVRERIASKCPQGDPPQPVERAPDGGLGEEQQIAPGQVNGFVGGRLIGSARPRDAPVGPVHVGDGQLQDGERPDTRLAGNGLQETTEVRLLDLLPRQAEPDVQGLHDLAPGGLVRDEDGAVHPAARQDHQLIGRRHGRPGTRTLTCRSRERRPATGPGGPSEGAPRSTGPAPHSSGFRGLPPR